ncbi:MAG: hypothetical protein JSU01_15395 [Bacteroidetes bacterium]|nr:hypothetical protein [Bacteroidota bacterium]
MDNNINDINIQNKPRNNGKVFAGLVLLVVGGILLLKQFDDLDIPGWIWSWPTWLILFGVYSGYKHNFQNATWFILIFIGTLGIADYAIPGLHLSHFIWPIAIISIGIWIILKRNHTWDKEKWDRKMARKMDKNKWKADWETEWKQKFYASHNISQPQPGQTAESSDANVPPVPPQNFSGDDFLDATSIFGGVKKTILSKNFKGGDVVNVFGGAEIDLTMADIDGKVVIEITQLFGGTKIIVPPHWQVVSNLSAVFAGVDDKRLRKPGSGDNNKVLVLEGISIFAGIEIRSF